MIEENHEQFQTMVSQLDMSRVVSKGKLSPFDMLQDNSQLLSEEQMIMEFQENRESRLTNDGYDGDVDMEQLFQSILQKQEIRRFESIKGYEDIDEDLKEKYKEWQHIVPVDCQGMRVAIPSTSDIKIKPALFWKLFKDMIGKDLSRFQMPVFTNEPITILMKSAEMAYHFRFMDEIAKMKDPMLRLVHLVSRSFGLMVQMNGRFSKPFNPLLGETYELVTPDFRILSEMVSHHPPVFCMNL